MFKKTVSIILCALISASVFLPVKAVTETGNPEIVITANENAVSETEAGSHIFEYIVNSLSELPVFACQFDRQKYTAEINQPCRENGYKCNVRLISVYDGTTTEYTVNIYDENTFQSHFINLGGDPFVTYKDGWYYYMVTGNGFYISKSRELNRVNSNPVSVFTISDLGFNVKELWAPELHFIEGYWYIYFTAYDGDTTGLAKNHRMYVLKSDTSDAQGSYTFMGQVTEIESDYINESAYSADTFVPGHYAIDQSIFEWNGKLYAVWSGWKGYTNISQRIYIAEMSDPCTISGSRVELSMPEYAYETYTMSPAVNEGPQPLISPDGGTLNIAFSVNTFVNSHYSLGMLTLNDGGNPLNPEDWNKSKKPVFESSQENSTYSVGHCSFVPSPDNSDYYMIYHARRTADGDSSPREIRAQQFSWYDDGTPCFGTPLSADSPVEIPSGTAIINRDSFEAESMNLSQNAQILSANSNAVTSYNEDYYSGGSRVALNSEGASATFTYTAENTGLYTLSLLASGNSASLSGISVTVNGTPYTKKICGNSNNINNFFWYDLNSVLISEGDNTITVSYTAAYKNGIYLDRVDIFNESDEVSLWESQNQVNSACKLNPVIYKKTSSYLSEADYGTTSVFDDIGYFDKYWFNTKPFIQEYEDTITSCGTGGNKRLIVSGEKFENIADFRATLSLSSSTAHTSDDGTQIKEEIGTGAVSSGLLFRVTEMKDISVNKCPFSGYRCFFIVGSDGKIKLQLHQYYFESDDSEYASSKMIAESGGLIYNPGDTYVMNLEVIGDNVNATAYNKNSPDTTVTITNVNLHISNLNYHYDCGQLGLFTNPKVGVVTFEKLSVTPLESSASTISDLGNLNNLSQYSSYTSSSSYLHTADNGIISMPSGVSKLILADEKYSLLSDIDVSAKIKLTSSAASIQTGFCFRVQEAVGGSGPGLTGYAVFLQRTSTTDNNVMVINLTKYGTKGTATNVNIGNQSFKDGNLLSDITDKSDITGLEFLFNASIKGDNLSVTVTRADNPSLTTGTLTWRIDSPDYSMNKTYPVYYESGKTGIFSNGTAQVSFVRINNPETVKYSLNAATSQNGLAALSGSSAAEGESISITLCADNGYYIDDDTLKADWDNGNNITPTLINQSWDNEAVYSVAQPAGNVNFSFNYKKIQPGDSNQDSKIDIRDLIRTKKYISGNFVNIALSNADITHDHHLNSVDLATLRNLLLDR